MAKSKKAKDRARKQRAHEQRAARHEDHQAAKPHQHLPHAGTPENRAYLHERQRQDLVAFGEFRSSRGPLPVIIGVAVGVLFALGILAWILFFI